MIDAHAYIRSDDFFENAPIYCQGARSGRELIRKKNIVDYIYAKKDGGGWIASDGKSRKWDKVFIKKTLYDTIPEVAKDRVIMNDDKVLMAPDIIVMDDGEKFRDEHNNVVDIETRGSRTVDGIYFKVKDVMIGFAMLTILTTIIDNRRDGYVEGTHYKYFICKRHVGAKKKSIKNANKTKKELFLTYEGMLRVLFASHSPRVKPFVRWATEKLFVLQMGTRAQKTELVGSVMGISAKTVKEVFNADRNTLPCVYLFILGIAKDLRVSMNIDAKYPDDSIIAKYGFTKELSRRTGEHMNKYNKIQNVDLKLKYYSYIDPQYMSSAETDIRDFMQAFKTKLDFDNEDELVIFPKELMKLIDQQYEFIGKKYMGHISELITRAKELEDKNDKQLLGHRIEMADIMLKLSDEKHKNEMKDKDIELSNERHKNEIKDKDIELLQYKIKILELQHR